MNYSTGQTLYGNDFNEEQIIQWFKEEEEAYAKLEGEKVTFDSFTYNNLDVLFGFSRLPDQKFDKVMGLGASWGYEFLPIIEKINHLDIFESSEITVSDQLGSLKPCYYKSNISGRIDKPDNYYDLITCFCVLHHIPNVSFVISELLRVLKPGGYLLIREPIHSMGDWNTNRPFLTKNERGIHYQLLRNWINENNGKIVKESFHFFMYSFLKRLLKNHPFLNSKFYLKLDTFLSRIFLFNFKYDPQNKIQRIAPQLVYYVIRKEK